MSDLQVGKIDILGKAIRASVAEGTLQPASYELEHYFPEGLYGRRCKVKKGIVFTTKVHKQEHLSVCLTGRIAVINEQGERVEIEAPFIFITPKGTHRAVYVLEDVDWLTVHAYTGEPDIDSVEQEVTCDSMEQYKHLIGGE